MTILDGLLPPGDESPSKLDELIEVSGRRISMLDLAELASLGAHEYDEEAAVPPVGSSGARFLTSVVRDYTGWLHRERRFPAVQEAGEVSRDWLMDEPVSQVAQAYVDLAMFFSHHADVARGAQDQDFRRVLREVAEQLVVTLTSEYGPLV
jgi:hypothetical protein